MLDRYTAPQGSLRSLARDMRPKPAKHGPYRAIRRVLNAIGVSLVLKLCNDDTVCILHTQQALLVESATQAGS